MMKKAHIQSFITITFCLKDGPFWMKL